MQGEKAGLTEMKFFGSLSKSAEALFLPLLFLTSYFVEQIYVAANSVAFFLAIYFREKSRLFNPCFHRPHVVFK